MILDTTPAPTVDGQVSSHPVQLPEGARRYQMVHPHFIPHRQQLIFGDGTFLYTLDYNGKAKAADFQPDESVAAPYFHPNGQRLLLTKGTYDSDVARILLPQDSESSQAKQLEAEVFERSISHEDIAKFHPDNEQIALVSKRIGGEQVWLYAKGKIRKLTNYRKSAYIGNLLWSASGNRLLVNVDLQLHQLRLDSSDSSSEQLVNFALPVINLFGWNSKSQKVTANILVNGQMQFVSLDLQTLQYHLINNKQVRWAAQSNDGTLIYVDHLNRFWRSTGLEDQLLAPLNDQLKKDNRFVLDQQVLYGINKHNQLWSYNLASEHWQVIGEVSPKIDYLTDINARAC